MDKVRIGKAEYLSPSAKFITLNTSSRVLSDSFIGINPGSTPEEEGVERYTE